MSEMIERVARQLCEVCVDDPDEIVDRLGEKIPNWKTYVRSARTAIEAMREPTGEMFIVGIACMAMFADHPDSDMSFPKMWNYLIDEALK